MKKKIDSAVTAFAASRLT